MILINSTWLRPAVPPAGLRPAPYLNLHRWGHQSRGVMVHMPLGALVVPVPTVSVTWRIET